MQRNSRIVEPCGEQIPCHISDKHCVRHDADVCIRSSRSNARYVLDEVRMHRGFATCELHPLFPESEGSIENWPHNLFIDYLCASYAALVMAEVATFIT